MNMTPGCNLPIYVYIYNVWQSRDLKPFHRCYIKKDAPKRQVFLASFCKGIV